ncbi:MAG: hypothetical protein NXI24_23775 [bacterium]|nr:hypothetical protein [bacterium]
MNESTNPPGNSGNSGTAAPGAAKFGDRIPAGLRKQLRLAYEIFFCSVLFINLLFVFFDATYLTRIPFTSITFRDLYLQTLPAVKIPGLAEQPQRISAYYDPIKGIEEHRTVGAYLGDVDELRRLLAVGSTPRNSAEVRRVLADLQAGTVKLLDQETFALANKRGTMEIIKNRMRAHMDNDSGSGSFVAFWDPANFNGDRAATEMAYFQTRIRPLIEQNYFRWIGEDGEPTNHFYEYDLWFILFFWIDFLVRWLAAIVRREYRLWYLFAVRNWYEIFNLLPIQHEAFLRLLRVIPWLYRMRDNKFLPDSGLAPQLIRENAGVIAEEISGMVLVNILKQVQGMMQNRGLKELATLSEEGVLDELEAFLDSQSELISKKVVPEIQPLIADLVEHSIDGSMKAYLDSPLSLAFRPMLKNVHDHVREGLYTGLAGPEGAKQMTGIMQKFIATLLVELSKEENVRTMEKQLAQLLEGMQSQVTLAIDRSRS